MANIDNQSDYTNYGIIISPSRRSPRLLKKIITEKCNNFIASSPHSVITTALILVNTCNAIKKPEESAIVATVLFDFISEYPYIVEYSDKIFSICINKLNEFEEICEDYSYNPIYIDLLTSINRLRYILYRP